ncbi:MAG: GNAT family N-acetyltransferase [Bacteroidales bacterium]|nr:GNAT family N-acetyltransferase [Bacteroidales bacterium]
MNNNNITIERAFNIDGLSSFSCGIREIDLLIHKKGEGGLLWFISHYPCEFYKFMENDKPIAIFVTSKHYVLIEEEARDSVEIDFLAVEKGEQKKGYGSLILNMTEEKCRENDYLFLTVGAFVNKRYNAIGFYEKNGFVINGEKETNAVPMLKYLGPMQQEQAE